MAYNQPPTTTLSHAPSNITSIYRQCLSIFLLSSDASLGGQHASRTRCASAVASWMGDAARSLALRSVRPLADENDDDGDEAAGYVAAGASNRRRNAATRGKAAAKNNGKVCSDHPGCWSDFVCMTCGTLLFPPPPPSPACPAADAVVADDDAGDGLPLLPTGDVRLRPLKRGRTRRRRASRSKARDLHDRALSLQRRGGGGGGGNSSTNDASRKDALSKERMRLVAYSHRLGDGRARNCIVAKCAHCGTRRKRKGVEVRKDEKKKGVGGASSAGVADDDDAARRRKGVGRMRQPPERRMTGKSNEASPRTSDDSDFISLISISGNGASKFPSRHLHRPDDERQGAGKRKIDEKDSFVSPLLMGKKKKKAKKTELEKKGDLMNFLSSLND